MIFRTKHFHTFIASRYTCLLLKLSCIGLSFVPTGCATDIRPHHYDVVVYGATPGGVTAAIQAAEMGKKVALLEPSGHIGGILAEGLGASDIDNHPEFQNSPAIGGLALEFYRRIAIEYDRLDDWKNAVDKKEKKPLLWRFESSVAEKILTNWVTTSGVDVYYQAALEESDNAVIKHGTTINTIRTTHGLNFTARIFIDASIEGDLLHKAGVSTIIGRESNTMYDEELNGIRGHTSHNQFAVAVDPYRIPGDSTSGLIPTIQDEPLGTPGAGDHRLQAYCFRVCLTNDTANQLAFKKPRNYRRDAYEIYLRYLKAGGKLYMPRVNIPNNKTDFNGGADLSHNLYGMNYDYPAGDYGKRSEVLQYHRDFTEGLFYFLANDEEVAILAPDLQHEWSKWGLTRDEFTDNDGWPRQFYIRDARRMVSDYVITEHHIKKAGAIAVDDPVAMAFWPPDVHSVRRIVRGGKAYNEGFVFGGDWWKPFGISYRALYPKPSECTNLLTPTCPSSSHIAYGGIRIEWTFMALGQAVGTAAVLAINDDADVQKVDYMRLRSRLLQDHQVLNLE
ncbi:FAD-dependent oxidoreductase [Parapedobacter indicus]|uniref:FAD dependent oxidoreductase n=1 Tax=Parapedobacter indicus TaxID=1477437 RepID=A0A1I3H2L8_9SPHI|nr:FAD-dependent oxidoreductase [Parapedobacter indicus]PPL02874.1 FAD dependent oxidoreductase [Parapedobacter indicus]SFI29896.1 FAD dependent oxidoreductase [Parapedobacter indicus]